MHNKNLINLNLKLVKFVQLNDVFEKLKQEGMVSVSTMNQFDIYVLCFDSLNIDESHRLYWFWWLCCCSIQIKISWRMGYESDDELTHQKTIEVRLKRIVICKPQVTFKTLQTLNLHNHFWIEVFCCTFSL